MLWSKQDRMGGPVLLMATTAPHIWRGSGSPHDKQGGGIPGLQELLYGSTIVSQQVMGAGGGRTADVRD